MNPKKISISDFSYPLPEEKIAYHPMHPRDSSKILISKNGEIREDIYRFMAGYLPENACLVFNDTRVIRSRIFFPKKTGAVIEIFCLEPYGDFTDYESFFSKTGSVLWKCMIGKAGKWKDQYLTKTILVDNREVQVRAELTERLPDAYIVKLSWSPEEISHGEIIAQAGVTPLPPYIKRTAEKQDENDYQTIYSEHDGSVAAPTAGLHFTAHLLADLRTRSIPTLFTTLHVGAGTFKPVTSDTMEDHLMHEEWMDISLEFLIQLSDQIQKDIVSVGTTACRTLESIYWMGNKILNKPDIGFDELKISQWEVYDTGKTHKASEAVEALISWMKKQDFDHLLIETGIIIAPGYTFRIINGLLTNFHMPRSTLLLLVAALVGEDWRKIYQYALDHNFRFLSYGDGSLLFP